MVLQGAPVPVELAGSPEVAAKADLLIHHIPWAGIATGWRVSYAAEADRRDIRHWRIQELRDDFQSRCIWVQSKYIRRLWGKCSVAALIIGRALHGNRGAAGEQRFA